MISEKHLTLHKTSPHCGLQMASSTQLAGLYPLFYPGTQFNLLTDLNNL